MSSDSSFHSGDIVIVFGVRAICRALAVRIIPPVASSCTPSISPNGLRSIPITRPSSLPQMSVTPRPRRAFVSNSGESNNTLPHSMGRIYNLGNLRELLSHLLLSHERRLFQDMSRLIIDRDRHSVRVYSFPN